MHPDSPPGRRRWWSSSLIVEPAGSSSARSRHRMARRRAVVNKSGKVNRAGARVGWAPAAVRCWKEGLADHYTAASPCRLLASNNPERRDEICVYAADQSAASVARFVMSPIFIDLAACAIHTYYHPAGSACAVLLILARVADRPTEQPRLHITSELGKAAEQRFHTYATPRSKAPARTRMYATPTTVEIIRPVTMINRVRFPAGSAVHGRSTDLAPLDWSDDAGSKNGRTWHNAVGHNTGG